MDVSSVTFDYITANHSLNMKNFKRAMLKTFDRLSISQQRKDKVNNNNSEGISKSSSLDKKRRWRSIKRVVPLPHAVPERRKWVQLAGHEDSFAVGEEGTILKKLSENEQDVLEKLMADALKPFVPHYKGVVTVDSKRYIEMEDLLKGFVDPCVMDCKMGVRTYLESELAKLEQKPELRPDMYNKMMKIDPSEPTEEEHRVKAITKPRYMQFRERLSSSASLGFRIEGIKNSQGKALVEFAHCRERSEIQKVIGEFANLSPEILVQYINRLKDLRRTCQQSEVFRRHEFIGSSLLFVHDKKRANVWMIDFGKTMQLPAGVSINHKTAWERGNHEDGYLTGLTQLIAVLEDLAPET